LGPVLREYTVAEAMHAMGIRSTRALAAVTTGELVFREATLPGAVLIRVAESHVRVGTFQYFTVRRDSEAVRRLADYVIDRHYPSARATANPYLALLDAVVDRQAALVASWMGVAFIHGVMNTDNMAISGETIDYGPCAFMDEYDPATVFSSIDRHGRYAFGNQPTIAQWNLARLAETLIPLVAGDQDAVIERATAIIRGFLQRYTEHWTAGMRRKLGLTRPEPEDVDLIQDLLDLMQASRADFTLTFRRLGDAAGDPETLAALGARFVDPPAFEAWSSSWLARAAREPVDPAARAAAMRRVNPAVIPRNHRVEAALTAAVEQGDLGPFESILSVLSRPYETYPDHLPDTQPPRDEERVLKTFCGT
jgi:uncharacterized protein YdiU (UPF0061 family)